MAVFEHDFVCVSARAFSCMVRLATACCFGLINLDSDSSRAESRSCWFCFTVGSHPPAHGGSCFRKTSLFARGKPLSRILSQLQRRASLFAAYALEFCGYCSYASKRSKNKRAVHLYWQVCNARPFHPCLLGLLCPARCAQNLVLSPFLRGSFAKLPSKQPIERLYKPPMNPYVVSSCLCASLRFPYATHVLAYAAVSEHVKLTHGLRVGVLSVSPQELLTRAPFLMQTPELFKTLRKKMTKNYPHESQRLGIVVLAASQETGYAAAASIARASGQPS